MTPSIWMKTICTGSQAAVVALYAPNAVLVPTFGVKPLMGQRQIAGYMREFMSKPGLCGRINTEKTQAMPGFEVYSGLYDFYWRGGEAHARYTFVMFGGKIITQHSSAVP